MLLIYVVLLLKSMELFRPRGKLGGSRSEAAQIVRLGPHPVLQTVSKSWWPREKFPAFYGTANLTFVFSGLQHQSLIQSILIQSTR